MTFSGKLIRLSKDKVLNRRSLMSSRVSLFSLPSLAPAGDLYEVPVEVSAQGGSDTAIVYVTKDGHYMLRGDLQDLNGDPLGDTMRKLNLLGAASKGPADAKIVIVEFGDLECPSCRQL